MPTTASAQEWRRAHPESIALTRERSRLKNMARRRDDPEYRARLSDTRRRYRQRNRDIMNAKQRVYRRQYRDRDRLIVLARYSGVGLTAPACCRCGFDDDRALTIDHINNDGAAQRANKDYPVAAFYRYLIRNRFPIGYQTLCWNCQWIKEHERRRTR